MNVTHKNQVFHYDTRGRIKLWNSGSVSIIVVHILKNPVNSYDSNGVIAVPISSLGDKKRNLPFFCLLIIPSESPERIGSYYTSLERHFRGEYNAVGIVRNGSELTEKFRKSVLRIQALGGNGVWTPNQAFWKLVRRRAVTLEVTKDSRARGMRISIGSLTQKSRESRVIIRLDLVSLISPLPSYGFRSNLVPTESYFQGASNATGYERFGEELAEDVGYYRKLTRRSRSRILVPSFLGTSVLVARSSTLAVLLQF